MLIFYISIVCTFALTQCNASLNVHNRMYVLLEATSPCILLLNGTHSAGCSSSRNGNVGVIHLVRNISELNWVIRSSPLHEYIVGVNLDMFTMKNLRQMNTSSKVVGVLLMQKTPRELIHRFSAEDTCPNRYSGLAAPQIGEKVCDDNEAWNPYGMGAMRERWNMPIFFTEDNQTIVQIEQCFEKFNLPLDKTQSDRSLCALELSSHMYASVNSPTCLRRSSGAYNINPIRYCDPLGDENIYVPILPLGNPKHKYIIVAARLDASSLFYGHTPGSLAVATSLVTLMLTAKLLYALTKDADTSKYDKNVLFVLFNGEAYDYIGSSRVVYDLSQKQFPFKEKPITFDDIELYVELSQLLNHSRITYHPSSGFSKQQSFIDKFIDTAKNLNFNVTIGKSSKITIPPSSMQSFLALNKEMPGLVFTSYDKQFENRYYHSLYDDHFNIKYTYSNTTNIPSDSLPNYLAEFATTLAHTLYETVSGQTAPQSSVAMKNDSDALLHCYVDTLNCYNKGTGLSSLIMQDVKPDFYVGVSIQGNQITLLIKYTLIYFMSRITNITDQQQCIDKNTEAYLTYMWIDDKKICRSSYLNSTPAISPAFVIPDYNMSSGRYSTWTESSWQLISVRMFMKPSRSYEWLVFVTGLSILVVSFALTYWIKRNAKELFNYPNLISASNI